MFERVTQGAVDVIQGDLPLNVDHVEELGELLHECLNHGQPYVVLDLEKVPLIDSAGLELLLDFKEESRQLGGALKLAAPSALCEEILAITGVGGQFEIFSETLSAVGSFVR
ncbi:MAG: STAS domain-containing protein [Pirellulales bacterium]|nr:STAS domain-containing protein [Pirellulales bacterium]